MAEPTTLPLVVPTRMKVRRSNQFSNSWPFGSQTTGSAYSVPRSAQTQHLDESYAAQDAEYDEGEEYEEGYEEYDDAEGYVYDEVEYEEPQNRRQRRRNRRRHDGTRGPRARGPRPRNPYRPLLDILQPVTTGADRTMSMSLIAFEALFERQLGGYIPGFAFRDKTGASITGLKDLN
ncbi:hypothetical protein ONS95_009495 [Cadophora gregata]|uniref:uncharacterized protein n=1 Tax=Cadophora gregata TaxID=51156 RepID=UPI0026DC25BB|nr:uncharacterized protein ONS95_009495 [Cadophora gregata]KAK0124547.1 hypothetical protein ONS95_009495 [Cadophora gregata]KAK0129600.1 hypothetical protein ONS96_000166 [Cadophora gregata f. sp. sojae]